MSTSTNNIDWEDIYTRLYAYADALLRNKSWFRGDKTDSFLEGKQTHDYVSEAIEQYLRNPEKYDPTTGRSLVNYLKYHLVRSLVNNDARSPENKTTKDILWTYDGKDDTDDSGYEDSILPVIGAYFDQEIDFNTIMSQIEEEIKGDKTLEEIFLGICCYGLKRREVIKEFNMAEKDFDNGIRRLNTILKNTAKKFDIEIKSNEG